MIRKIWSFIREDFKKKVLNERGTFIGLSAGTIGTAALLGGGAAFLLSKKKKKAPQAQAVRETRLTDFPSGQLTLKTLQE